MGPKSCCRRKSRVASAPPAHACARDLRQQDAAARRVGPVSPDRVDQRDIRRIGRRCRRSLAEQQSGDEGLAEIPPAEAVFVVQTTSHLEQIAQGDRLAGVALGLPLDDRRPVVQVEPTLTNQDAEEGVRDALGHRPGLEATAGAEALGVALEDQASVLDDQQRPRVWAASAPPAGEESLDLGVEGVAIEPFGKLSPRPLQRRPRHALRLRRQGQQRFGRSAGRGQHEQEEDAEPSDDSPGPLSSHRDPHAFHSAARP